MQLAAPDCMQDMRDECSKHGSLRRVIIPRPTPTVPNPPGLAKVRSCMLCGQRLCVSPTSGYRMVAPRGAESEPSHWARPGFTSQQARTYQLPKWFCLNC